MSDSSKAPLPTLERLATYLTVLTGFKSRNVETVSSIDIEQRAGVNAAQIRKDLSFFGEFGKAGVGYNVEALRAHIARILKLDNTQKVLLVGAGNLGSALAGYPALRTENFKIVAVFDSSPRKVGTEIWGIPIKDITDLADENRSLGAKIGIIAVPASAAQQVAEKLIEAGVHNILNFAPIALRLPKEVTVRNVDFVQELAVLSYHIRSEPEQL
jgi:redox-sensing transcriptional repressor